MAKDDGGKVPADPLTKMLVPDPADVPELMSIAGWIGKSGKSGHQRLYLNPNMSAWLEVPISSIKHWAKTGLPESPLSGTMIWVERGEKLTLHRTTSSRAEEAYRLGRIAGQQSATPGNPYPTTWNPNMCWSVQWPITRFEYLCYEITASVES